MVSFYGVASFLLFFFLFSRTYASNNSEHEVLFHVWKLKDISDVVDLSLTDRSVYTIIAIEISRYDCCNYCHQIVGTFRNISLSACFATERE